MNVTVAFEEQSKNVIAKIKVEGDNTTEVEKEAKSLFDRAFAYSQKKSLSKGGI